MVTKKLNTGDYIPDIREGDYTRNIGKKHERKNPIKSSRSFEPAKFIQSSSFNATINWAFK